MIRALPRGWTVAEGLLRAPSGGTYRVPPTRTSAVRLARYLVFQAFRRLPREEWVIARAGSLETLAWNVVLWAKEDPEKIGLDETDVGACLATYLALVRWDITWADAPPETN